MPEKKTLERARKDLKEGKSPSTAAGEFVKQEIEHIRDGKHGARSVKQAIAIGLSEARRAGIPLPPPKRASAATKKAAERDSEIGEGKRKTKPSAKRSAAAKKALKKEPRAAGTKKALSKHAKATAGAAKKTRAENAAKGTTAATKKKTKAAVKKLGLAAKAKAKPRAKKKA